MLERAERSSQVLLRITDRRDGLVQAGTQKFPLDSALPLTDPDRSNSMRASVMPTVLYEDSEVARIVWYTEKL